MDLSDIDLTINGDNLTEALHAEKTQRKAIAEDLLYEKTCLMIAADPGSGKSTVSLQAAVELAAGLPVFGHFPVGRSYKVLYAQNERHIMETIERLKDLKNVLPVDVNNIHITDEYQKLNLLHPKQCEILIKSIQRDCPDVDVIFFDPIYTMVKGGLSKDEPASAFTKAMSLIEKYTGAALWLNHHTTKATYHNGQMVDKVDPFYGSQWIKAHVTGSYYMKTNDKGVVLEKKKDNYSILAESINLEYDPETSLCSVDGQNMKGIDKVKQFIRIKKIGHESFTFSDLKSHSLLCNKTLRLILLHTSIKNMLDEEIGNKNKKIYTPKQDKKEAISAV